MSGDQIQDRIIIGTWSLFDWSRNSQSPNDAVKIVDKAYKSGYHFFDTAAVYGSGKAELTLSNIPQDAEIHTKLPAKIRKGASIEDSYPVEYFERALHSSLRRLGRDRINTLYLHNWNFSWKNTDHIKKLVDCVGNRAEYFGVSLDSDYNLEFDYSDIQQLMKTCSVFQVPYSVARQGNKDKIKFLLSKGKKVVLRSVLAHGMLIKRDSELQKRNPSFNKYSKKERDQLREKVWGNSLHEKLKYCLMESLSIGDVGVVIGISKAEHITSLDKIFK